MPESYPIPDYAVSIWVAGDDLLVAFPGQGAEGRGHTVRLPASATGLATAITILKDRQRAKSLRLGQPGTPTQYELEAGYADFLARLKLRKEQREAKEKAKRERAEHDRITALQKETFRRAAAEELRELGL